MEVKARLGYLRIAPRKVRLIADMIRWKNVEEAQTILRFVVKKSSHPLLKLLNSAVASAKNNNKIEVANLFISKITVDEGPKYKRFMPRARGSAAEIQKKTSHVNLVLSEKEGMPRPVKEQDKDDKRGTLRAKEPKAASSQVVDKSFFDKGMGAKEKKTGAFERPGAKQKTERPKQPRGINRLFRRKTV